MNATESLDLDFTGRRKVPVVLQAELAECGLACLAMIAGYHGHELDLGSLRRRWSVSVKGMALSQLMEMAQHLCLTPRALRLETGSLHKLTLPCVLHWDMDHFVVLEAIVRGKLRIVDPAVGRRTVDYDEAARKFTGVALELVPAEGFKAEKERSRLRLAHLLRDTNGLPGALTQVLAFSMAIQVFALAMPFYSQLVIDDVVVGGDLDLLNLLLLSFAALVLVHVVIGAFRSWVIVYLGMKIKLIWTSRLFFHLVRLPMSYFDSRHIGDIQSRYGSLSELQDLVTTKFVEAAVDGAMTVTTVLVLFLYDAFLAGIVVISTLVYLAIRLSLYPTLRRRAHEAIVAGAKKDTYLLETLRGLLTIKTFNMEHRRESAFQNKVAETINRDVRVFKVGIFEETTKHLIYSLQFLVVVWLAARSIVNGGFTVGMMVAFLAYRTQFSERSAQLVDKIIEFRLARVHLDRLSDIVETEIEPGHLEPGRPAFHDAAAVKQMEARDIWYRYADTEPYILKGASFLIEAGAYTVISGASGLGKTTLLKIMMGLLVPTKGEILLDGRSIADYGVRNYRNIFAAVMQDDVLLAGTLLENISFFDPLVDVDRVIDCAKAAAISDDIANMPMQYFTLVGDMGTALSGGQKQRILLARALYKSPAILFLDEATSHLDIENERNIVNALKDRRITVVGIAHRAESVRRADRLIRIEEVIGSGRSSSHNIGALASSSGQSRLYNRPNYSDEPHLEI
jgi:ATP-binding cassette subfamily B protein RaxB